MSTKRKGRRATSTNKKPPQSAEELLDRYEAGERNFPRASLVGANLNEVDLQDVNLSGANLSEANLNFAELEGVNLRDANLRHANLVRANLRGATLAFATLQGAFLYDACLMEANLCGATLDGASLVSAVLCGTNLYLASLKNANCGGAKLGLTLLLDIDLAPLCDANPCVEHAEKSTVDLRSITRSLHSLNLRAFLQRTGMPAAFVEYAVDCAESLDESVTKKLLQSTFISYGDPDEAFARRLYETLYRSGVATFFFAEHAVPGEKLHRTMRKAIAEYDRVILICSHASLDREGVLFEIEEAMTRESKMNGESLLIPIRLDRYVFDEWKPKQEDLAEAVRSRVVADFEGADQDEHKFQRGLRQLIAALRK